MFNRKSAKVIAPQLVILDQTFYTGNEFSSLNRRNVPDQEKTDTWQRIKIDPLFTFAWDIVCRAFGDGRRRSGTLHTEHARIVAKGALELTLQDNCEFQECLQNAVVGLLHDVKEDHPKFSQEVNNLVHIGLQPEALHAINLLTKSEGETAFDNASRVMTSRMAIRAKLPDSKHNSSANEQVTSIAFGDISNSLRRYSICIPAYQAVLEGRYTNVKEGIKGYLRTIGQNLLTPENREIFQKGFGDPDDILRLIDLKAPILQEKNISIILPSMRSLNAKLRFKFRKAVEKMGIKFLSTDDDLSPMDSQKTLVETASQHPSRN